MIYAIQIIKDGYEQIIYINADEVKSIGICASKDSLDDNEKELFGNTELGKDFAVFEPESLA